MALSVGITISNSSQVGIIAPNTLWAYATKAGMRQTKGTSHAWNSV